MKLNKTKEKQGFFKSWKPLTSKKASLGIIITIIIVLVSALMIYGITFKFFKTTFSEGTQQQICKADIIVSQSILSKEDKGLWRFDQDVQKSAAKTRLEHPFCTTHTKLIDLDDLKKESKYKKSPELEIITVEIGEMIESCWKTFGNGEIVNTFGQGNFDDTKTYYFPCYAFKIKTKNEELRKEGIQTITIQSLLWLYNLRGQPLTGLESVKEGISSEDATTLIQDTLELSMEGEKGYQSYSSLVFLDSPGYIEFMDTVNSRYEEVNPKMLFTGIGLEAGGLATVAVIAASGGPITLVLAIGIGGVAVAGYGVYKAFKSNYKILGPGAGEKMDTLHMEEWYEVRYYSPYVEKPKEYSEGYVLNNIKIVPYDSFSDGTQAGGTTS